MSAHPWRDRVREAILPLRALYSPGEVKQICRDLLAKKYQKLSRLSESDCRSLLWRLLVLGLA